MNLEIEQLSPLELRFEQLRRRLGLILAPAAFAYVAWREFPSLSVEAHHLAAVMAAVVVLPLTRMIRYGLLLDVAGVTVIVVLVRLLGSLLR